MGREVRRVPANWEHPKNENGNYIPMFGRSFAQEVADWDEAAAKWEQGLKSDWQGGWKPKDADETFPYSEWAGDRPVESDYMPDWPESERTHYQMYEDTSEGTPISPVMERPRRWPDGLRIPAPVHSPVPPQPMSNGFRSAKAGLPRRW